MGTCLSHTSLTVSRKRASKAARLRLLSRALAVYATANVSGGHVNPAVTLGNCLTGHMSWGRGGLYAAVQMLGAIFGTLIEVTVPAASCTHWDTVQYCQECERQGLEVNGGGEIECGQRGALDGMYT
jgi:hypothetical protein